MSKSFRELTVWQKSMELVTNVYRATSSFPSSEKYGLTNQIRRCAVSIPSNIAEGQGRNSPREFVQFLGIAKGSLCELEIQLQIATNLGFLENEVTVIDQINQIGKMLTALKRVIDQKQSKNN